MLYRSKKYNVVVIIFGKAIIMIRDKKNTHRQFDGMQIVTLFIFIFIIIEYFKFTNDVVMSIRLKIYLAIAFGFIGVSFFAFSFLFKKISIEKMTFLIVIFLGIATSMILTPGSAPDEMVHYMSSYEYSNRILNKSEFENATISMRSNDFEEGKHLSQFTTFYDYEMISNGSILDHSESYEQMPFSTIFPWYKYIPATLGVTMARVLHLGKWPMIYLGRLFNLLFFACCMYVGIKIIPKGKAELMAFALVPYMIEQASSFSYDAISNGLAVLFVSLSLYCFENIKSIKIIHIVLLGFIFIYLMQFKGIYVGFILLFISLFTYFIMYNWEAIKEHLRINKKLTCVIITVTAIFVIIFSVEVVQFLAMKSTDFFSRNIYYQTEFGYQETWCLYDFIESPRESLNIFISGVTGVLSRVFGGNFTFAWVGAYPFTSTAMLMFFISMMASERGQRYNKSVIYISVASCIIIGLLGFFGPLFSWTPRIYDTVWGMQPRYFLPILMCVLCIGGSDERISTRQTKILFLVQICVLLDLINALNISLYI